MKKVLIISTEYYDYYKSVEESFKSLGWNTNVEVYYYQVMNLREKITYNLFRIIHGDEAFKILFNRRVLKTYSEFKPDLVFVFQAVPISAESMKFLSQSKSILWIMESIYEKRHIYDIRKYFDSLFLYIESDLPKLYQEDKTKAYFLPCAVNEKVYYPQSKSEEIDILFIGNLNIDRLQSQRAMLLLEIVKRFQKLNIKIYGTLSPALEEKFSQEFPRYKEYFQNKTVTPQMANSLYNKSKICINIHSSGRTDGTNQRFFELLGSKSFQIVNENDFINTHFTDREVVTYKNEQDLFNKISYFIENNNDRIEISENGYEKVISGHTFKHRISTIIDAIERKTIPSPEKTYPEKNKSKKVN